MLTDLLILGDSRVWNERWMDIKTAESVVYYNMEGCRNTIP